MRQAGEKMPRAEFEKRVAAAQENLLREPDPYEADPTLRTCTDPVRWCEAVLGVKLWPKQAEILRSFATNRVTAVRSCHGIGKSFVGGLGTIWPTQVNTEALVITTAPTARQVGKILWREIHKFVRRSRGRIKGDLLKQELRVSEFCTAFGFTAQKDSSDRFQGLHDSKIFVIVDEASAISQEIFDAIDAISTGDSHVLYLSNPLEASGPYRKLFSDSNVMAICISAFDTPNLHGITLDDIRANTWAKKINADLQIKGLVDAAWVRRMWEKHGEESVFWRTRVLGEFPDADQMGVIQLRDVVEAQKRIYVPSDQDSVYFSLDVARLGGDKAVLWMKRGHKLTKIWEGSNLDTTAVVGFVLNAIRKLDLKRIDGIFVDTIGVGGGVFDQLKELGAPVISVCGSERASDVKQWANIRAEMYCRAAEAFHTQPIDLSDDESIAEQLCSVRIKSANSQGGVLLEPKDDVKKRIGRSPDDADAIAQFWAPISMQADFRYMGSLGLAPSPGQIGHLGHNENESWEGFI